MRNARPGWALGLLLLCVGDPALAQPSRFDAPADLFNLHPLVNYAVPLSWTARFERERLSSNGIQATVGSISTRDFVTLVRVDVDEPATEHLRLLYRLDWTDSPHLEGPERQNWLGLELGGVRTPAGRVGIEALANPPSDKGDLDTIFGIVWTDAARTDYLRLGVRSDDFVYEDKNDVGGLDLSVARGPVWAAHVERGAWSLSSEGTLLSRQRRAYPDPDRSPDLAASSLLRRWSSSALRFGDRDDLLELRFEHRDTDEVLRDQQDDVRRRRSEWRHLALAYERTWQARWRLRLQLHGLHVDSRLDTTDHRRRETLGGVFLERRLGRGHWIEVSTMATDHRWTSTPADPRFGPDRDGLASKLGLGWTYELGTRGWYRVTLSHEPDPQAFGGGNMQVQMNF